MKVSDYIVHFFESKGVNIIFGYQGGMITHLVDSIARNPKMRFIQVYHEQTGAIAAEGYARISGKPGVCISTSGPGATNMITGIADAYFDSIPTIYITGQVNSYEYKYEKKVRQLGFQETDVVTLVKGITKYAVMVEDPNMIKYELQKAYNIALSGRQGPVLLDIPMNVSRADIVVDGLMGYCADDVTEPIAEEDIAHAAAMIMQAKRPMFLLGGGVISSGSGKLIEQVIRESKIPFVTSLMGRGAIDESIDQYQGMLGSYGNRMANICVHEADLVIALGSRLDTRQTGAKYQDFLRLGQIIHVDIDQGELDDHRLEGRFKIHGNVIDFVRRIKPVIASYKTSSNWTNYCRIIKDKYNQRNEIERFVQNKAPYLLLEKLNEYLSDNDIVTIDIGQNQMWAAQTLNMCKNRRFLTSGGLAPMGYAMPAAIGAAFGCSYDCKIWSIVGDGGFHISTQSLGVISQYKLPIGVVVINNESLGMITQFQELYFDSNFAGTDYNGGYVVPDIKYLAKSYSIPYFRINQNDLSDKKRMDEIFDTRYCIIEYMTLGKTKVSPKLEFDKPINQPSPFLPQQEQDKIRYKC